MVRDGAETKSPLTLTLGRLAIVRKSRRVFVWRSVRIHVDRVDGLGCFVEVQAVAPPHSDLVVEPERLAYLQEALGIGQERVCATGYADMLGDVKALAVVRW